jgi:hypothetical protein
MPQRCGLRGESRACFRTFNDLSPFIRPRESHFIAGGTAPPNDNASELIGVLVTPEENWLTWIRKSVAHEILMAGKTLILLGSSNPLWVGRLKALGP